MPKRERIEGAEWVKCEYCQHLRQPRYTSHFARGLLLDTADGLCVTNVPTTLCRHCISDLAVKHQGIVLEWRSLASLAAPIPRPWKP